MLAAIALLEPAGFCSIYFISVYCRLPHSCNGINAAIK